MIKHLIRYLNLHSFFSQRLMVSCSLNEHVRDPWGKVILILLCEMNSLSKIFLRFAWSLPKKKKKNMVSSALKSLNAWFKRGLPSCPLSSGAHFTLLFNPCFQKEEATLFPLWMYLKGDFKTEQTLECQIFRNCKHLDSEWWAAAYCIASPLFVLNPGLSGGVCWVFAQHRQKKKKQQDDFKCTRMYV